MFTIYKKMGHPENVDGSHGKPMLKLMSFLFVMCILIFLFSTVNAQDSSRPPSSGEKNINGQIKTPTHTGPVAFCDGSYAGDMSILSPAAKKAEENTQYTFCVRSTAVYQCPYYNPDGVLQMRRETKAVHGTAFVFRADKNHAYLLTNEHVAEWPLVTTKDTPVDNIPIGCRRVSRSAVLVDNENDAYAVDDVAAKFIAADAELDVAILKAPVKDVTIPFVLGQSASLKVGDTVRVRGFPLGEFQAVNVGRVVNPRQRDTEGQWNHDDFVIDAQLSAGQSGSPVLAVSCRTRQLELVGIYHAGYEKGQAMNVVVGIDEFREMLATLKPRAKNSDVEYLRREDRTKLVNELKKMETFATVISYGNFTVGVRVLGEKIYYEIFSKNYPVSTWRHMVLEDLPSESFGCIGRLWFGNESGLKEKVFSELSPAEQAQISTLIIGLRHRLHQTLQLRQLEPQALQSRAAYDRLRILQRQIKRKAHVTQAQMQAVIEWASKFAPGAEKSAVKKEAVTDDK